MVRDPAGGNWTIVIDSLHDIKLQSRLYIPHATEKSYSQHEMKESWVILVLYLLEQESKYQEWVRKSQWKPFGGLLVPRTRQGCPDTGQHLTLLGGLPPAVAQAATYIRTTHMPTAHFLALFRKSEEHQEALLSKPLLAPAGP